MTETHPSTATPPSSSGWSPDSWRRKSVHQDVTYENPEHLKKVLDKLERLPPLVAPGEIEKLKGMLREVAEGKRFLLQGGDCAELFDYCSQEPIQNKLKVLLQMSLILVWGGRTKVVRIARMAGQYAKPRSKPVETIDGVEYTAFRGDNVNGMPLNEREPDPERLLGAYFHSAATVNYVRALLASDFADLHHPESWNLQEGQWSLEHVRNPYTRSEYREMVNQLQDALDFMQTIGAEGDKQATRTVDMFMSHEGLLLEYEARLTRECPVPRRVLDSAPPSPRPAKPSDASDAGSASGTQTKAFYNLGTHFLWIGDRTRQLTGAHVEYFKGIENPIGVKIGPSMRPEEIAPLLDILNPRREVGKVTLITRYGAGKVREYLPKHIAAVAASGHKVVWCCDPMHGNTETTASGLKTRRFDHIVRELSEAFEIHQECGSYLGGVHCELTGDPVTETIGGSMNLVEEDLSTNYQTFCDPRLNYNQSLDIAFLIAKFFKKQHSQ
ncbi:hypothetical protein HK105_203922 [Polyrhizophydium stewartii]|uniref:Phospho-2-dehydro-3-deoxyheptonate aldolase n=1 Tax=Polyrhizophydium stewartii TaxID=2732419 RepID=A0ABR4NAL5_9FUNG|nr:hypothetical protein HK105_000263 [Polyrhizophydium stewartii]